jgi:antitoxin ParD1/3/4
MSTRNISLTEHYDQFVSNVVNTGRYQNASEVVRAGLRLLEDRENEQQAKLKNLKRIAKDSMKSMNSGDFSPLSFDQIADGVLARSSKENHG